ncbi:MAG: bifunctional proline dehydrogenase/L-glutamate gamma-semialdehyde dehydrogenase PutA [Gammaproteobacteria bacterium]
MPIVLEEPSLEDPSRASLRAAYLADEQACVAPLLTAAVIDAAAAARVAGRAQALALGARARGRRAGSVDAFLHEYDLSSQEGILLMCLAEALLRIPDPGTQERLIQDKLARGHWDAHLGHSRSLLVNAGTWGLLLTGRIVVLDEGTRADPARALERLLVRGGGKVLRLALRHAIGILARQFVVGRDMEEALARSREPAQRGLRFSYDCLGEAARGAADAERYLKAYRGALSAIAAAGPAPTDPVAGPGISVKLSALHPRYQFSQRPRVHRELIPRLRALVVEARAAGIAVSLDAEEAERLELLLDVFGAVFHGPELDGWEGLGMAVQAYQKRARPVLAWLAEQAQRAGRRIPVRLVKGAYWDSEIKRAQELGLDGYPVFTRKAATDVSYLACARDLLDRPDVFYPQFATHNAHTVAYILEAAGTRRDFEFQRLHGMGEELYQALAEDIGEGVACRVYAPVGGHEALLPYLMRRLLENGANTSFVNRLVDEAAPIDQVIADPVVRLTQTGFQPNPRTPPPPDLYGAERRNARGMDLADPVALQTLRDSLETAAAVSWQAAPLIGGEMGNDTPRPVHDPADRRRVVGTVVEADGAAVAAALARASTAAPDWDLCGADTRAACLERAADQFEAHAAELVYLCVREGGRTVPDALAEVREAVDYCRYYALCARRDFGVPRVLPGPTGEDNQLHLRGRGVFACISPWNFPLAIFTGQIAAALASGNAVLAKPARQTPLVACHAIRLLHKAGVPADVLRFLPGSGVAIGAQLLSDPRLAGIAFTGSTETAWTLQQRLAERRGPIVPLIAETGGQNAMIVDSSALVEQVVADVLTSAFNSAGQRCSALRVVFIQEEMAERLLDLLAQAMDELRIGDPARLDTDVGPLIDAAAAEGLQAHVARMDRESRLCRALALPPECGHGSYFAPRLYEIPNLALLDREVFGPILHAVRYPAGALDQVIDAINATGYGLTLGVHTRIDATWERVRERARAGNLYVNRNMIGAVVGVQPFGGEGLSGTGPKAGGPHYLHRFALERTVSINTAAAGGNAGLLSLTDE